MDVYLYYVLLNFISLILLVWRNVVDFYMTPLDGTI